MNYVISVINPKEEAILTDICKELELPLVFAMRGRGTAVREVLDILGIESNEKRIVVAVCGSDDTKKLIKEQKRRLFTGMPGHSVVISVPVKSVGGGRTMAFLNKEQPVEKQVPELNYDYELIVAICNGNRTDMVMNAARNAGARGGTVIHGKGTGRVGTEKFGKLSIFDEREVILIVTKAAEKKQIMQSVLKNAGPDSEAGTIILSLPVTEAAGFNFSEEE